MLTVSRFAIDAHRSPHIGPVEVQIACTDAEMHGCACGEVECVQIIPGCPSSVQGVIFPSIVAGASGLPEEADRRSPNGWHEVRAASRADRDPLAMVCG
jgi:hypothetical protein